MKQRHSFFTATGIPSLFLIFSVLCLVVLSLLTLGTSRSEQNAAQLSLQHTEDYYTACAKATDMISKFQETFQTYYCQSDSQESFFTLVSQFADNSPELSFDSQNQTLLFSEPFSDTQQLTVNLHILYPDTADNSFIQILQWKTDSTVSWTPDNSQSVYKGGNS